MESRQGCSPEASHDDSNETGAGGRMRRRFSRPRSRSRRKSQGKHQARSDSVGSLDRIFHTPGSVEPSIPIARAPTLASNETNLVEKSHGIDETRDGFFDAVFLPPEEVDNHTLMKHAEATLPLAFRERNPLSLKHFLPTQCHEAWTVICLVVTTRSGIKLLKSFLGFFITYILCLIPAVRERFGRYTYIMVVSAILNHPGRTLGAQIDGTVLTIIGTTTGLGWGAFGLWVSTTTAAARVGFGAVLAAFLFVYIFIIACLRSYYIRTYQFVICSGIAISYTCLAEISGTEVSWIKLLAYGIPWLIGQAVSLFVCGFVAPDAGSRPLAVGIHQIFDTMLDGIPPVQDSVRTRRRLAQAFVSTSQVYRDLVIDFSITKLSPKDVLMLRNSVQAVIRTLRKYTILKVHHIPVPAVSSTYVSLKTGTRLSKPPSSDVSGLHGLLHQDLPEFTIEIDRSPEVSGETRSHKVVEFVTESLATPTEDLLQSMKYALQNCDAALMDICGHRHYLGPPYTISSDLRSVLVTLREHITVFSDVLGIFAFCRSVHQAASAIESLVIKIGELQQRQPKYPQFHLPSYPIRKAIYRTNAQVRHDRGGVTAGSYFRSLSDITKMIKKIRSQDFRPVPSKGTAADGFHNISLASMTADGLSNSSSPRQRSSRHKVWALLHRMQGFETRFGLKTALATSLLALPAYLTRSHSWWDRYEGWWGVVMGWLILGPRTGGNVQDLFTRALCAVLGSLWAGLSFTAGNGNPYIMAVFAAIFMLPMMYRYTQSTHPRSGIVGCITFTVVSLSEKILSDVSIPEDSSRGVQEGKPSVATIAATRGAAMVFGVIVSIIINWALWPFVARHDLRKGLASMIFNCSIVYRSTISKYIYYEEGNAPTKQDVETSEILEGRLREGFVRLRQLLGLTRHEIRLRAPFDPLPYSALINACEQLFDHIVIVRQSSLFYHPNFTGGDSKAAMDLLSYRRDEIATVLTILYVLSGALRANRPIPRYLPNAAIARRRLLDRMLELERKHAASENYSTIEKQWEIRLGEICSYSFNDNLTGCVDQVKQLEKYTKIIVGEQGTD
ncbi:hypothetical protein NUW58_g3765 [Xylaria curta]|uniref:Uncharacterized protein n=1 Tax=Xylaria curta TaxID=42375 RepID=A0ACC1PC22_9PEZI|nr:hypothetical protein NUW58_g3765 [Xylaria curta]